MSSPRFATIFITSPILAILGLYQFTTSFFLAKQSLPHISTCRENSAPDLLQETLGLTTKETEILFENSILSSSKSNPSHISKSIRYGCWMNRRVDAMAVIVVDALRFDFALEHLPNSIGSRISSFPEKTVGHSQLFQFVADPPTVTMQRLKGLTTGGLPTFADISGSFGGATVDEDSWVDQLVHVNHTQRLFKNYDEEKPKPQIAFVGDDTWTDLFPTQFDDAHPYPSFNTRDLDTVDDGCLLHLPRLLRMMGDLYEVIVVHFLGVDHVGHTYGPNNPHMEEKLHQMDGALSKILDKVDTATSSCQSVFIFGDHGMTEDGNHGGGTSDEMNAALFSHYSPGCGDMTTNPTFMSHNSDGMRKTNRHAKNENDDVEQGGGVLIEEAFQSIHQIDLVPTISLLLGLPIPYANLGGLVPALIPPSVSSSKDDEKKYKKKAPEATMISTALALNAAQVWNYLTSYSKHSNSLPKKDMQDLNQLLVDATIVYKSALSTFSTDEEKNEGLSSAFHEASGLFKLFLSEATEMGKRVWTRFDTVGMGVGIVLLFFALLLGFPSTHSLIRSIRFILQHPSQVWRKPIPIMDHIIYATSFIFVICHCILLTFSNSYIEAEQGIVIYMMAILCIFLGLKSYVISTFASLQSNISQRKSSQSSSPGSFVQRFIDGPGLIFLLPFLSRCNELFITGHGMDPSLHVHFAHNPFVFFMSLLLLGFLRHQIFSIYPIAKAFDGSKHVYSKEFPHWISLLQSFNNICDYSTLFCLFFSWVEKHSEDKARNGYTLSFFAIVIPSTSACFVSCLFYLWSRDTHVRIQNEDESHQVSTTTSTKRERVLERSIVIAFKILLFIVTVTGPSSAMTAALFVMQVMICFKIMNSEDHGKVTVLSIMFEFCL